MKRLTDDEILQLKIGDHIVVKYVGKNPSMADPTGDPLIDTIFDDIKYGFEVEITGVMDRNATALVYNYIVPGEPIGAWGIFVQSKTNESGTVLLQDDGDLEIWRN